MSLFFMPLGDHVFDSDKHPYRRVRPHLYGPYNDRDVLNKALAELFPGNPKSAFMIFTNAEIVTAQS